ncbi:MAG: hypothetical protein ACRDKT_09320 [Actinomycetota bacterium]
MRPTYRTPLALLVAVVLAVGLVFATVSAPAGAKKKDTIFYLHGKDTPVGEAHLPETWIDGAWMTMDGKKPGAGAPSSMFVTNYLRGPNTDCDGNGLLPVWKGDYSGTFKGDVKIHLHTVATPAVQMTVSLYRDPTGTCTATPPVGDSQAPKPVATDLVDVAPGHAETVVTFKKVKFTAMSGLLLQLSIPTMTTPGQVRILFDSADLASTVHLEPR